MSCAYVYRVLRFSQRLSFCFRCPYLPYIDSIFSTDKKKKSLKRFIAHLLHVFDKLYKKNLNIQKLISLGKTKFPILHAKFVLKFVQKMSKCCLTSNTCKNEHHEV